MSTLGMDFNGNIVNAFAAGTTQVLSCTTTSQQSAVFGATTNFVRVATVVGHCHVQFGASPTASITTSMMLPPNTTEIFNVTPGQRMAFIRDSGTAVSTVSVTELV
jgi:hypothetical protein